MSAKNMRATMVVLEGTDGSGKSTLSKALVEQRLHRWPTPPVRMAYPSNDGEVGKLIRKSFARQVTLGDGQLDGSQDRVLGYLMVADAIDREHVVRGHLADGKTVICDRHPTISGWVYQRGCMSTDEILAIQQRRQFVQPGVVFVLDVAPATLLARIASRNDAKNPIFERDGEAYYAKLRERYRAYAAMHDNVVILDGSKSVDDLMVAVHGRLKDMGVLL